MPLPQPPIEPSSSSSSAEYELSLVPARAVVDVWPMVREFVERAIPRAAGRMSADDVLIACVEGRMGLWIIGAQGQGIVAVGVTEVLKFPRKRVLSVLIFSGNRRRVQHLWPRVEEHARDMHCEEVQVSGPRAWGRIFPDYEEQFTVFTRRVV